MKLNRGETKQVGLAEGVTRQSDLRSDLDGNDLDVDPGQTFFVESQSSGCSVTQVDNAFPGVWVVDTGERSTVVDPDDNRSPVFQVRHPDVDR